MPTENRSSSTEMASELRACPFCSAAMRVESNRDWHRVMGDHTEECVFTDSETMMVPATDAQRSIMVADWNQRTQPAEQNQGKPINLTAVATLVDDGDGGLEASWLLEGGTAELFAGMTLLVAENAPDLCAEDGSAQVYSHADPAEVVSRLKELVGPAASDERIALRNEVEQLRDQLAAWQALAAERLEVAAGLRTQLAETHALLDRVVDHAKFWHDHPYAEVIQVVAEDYKALSASAEPRPVIAWHVGGNGYDRICFEEPTDLPGHPCIQAVNDQSQLAQLLKRYDLRNEDVPPDERVHGIPGTSFQRLNALANEGE